MSITMRALVAAAAVVLAALAGRALLSRLVRPDTATGAEPSADLVMEALAGLYGVLVAFLLAGAWDRIDETRTSMILEASAVANLRLVASFLPSPLDRDLGAATDSYQMQGLQRRAGERPVGETEPGIARIYRVLASFEPSTAAQSELQSRAFDAVDQLTEQSRRRVVTAPRRLHPLLWVILVSGGAGVLTVVALSRPGSRLPAVYLSILAALIGFALYAIFAMSDPVGSGLAAEPFFQEVLSPPAGSKP